MPTDKGWRWLSAHPHRAEIVNYVVNGGAAPSFLRGDRHAGLVARDRTIHAMRQAGLSIRKIGEELGFSGQLASVCLRVYSGDIESKASQKRRSVKKRANEAITLKTILDLQSGKITTADIAKMLGDATLDAVYYWVKKKTEDFGL